MAATQDIDTASEDINDVITSLGEAIITDREFLETVMTGLLARGHVLIEDVPGTGKTLTGITLADALGLEFNRIQFTPDLLPSDITGSQIFNEQSGTFRFQQGPIFSNVVLADEINRAPPKTQAALLEAMGEGQVSVGGTTHQLPDPFFVIATQNPIEQSGTFELPAAQQDRFLLKTSIGYPDQEGELELVTSREDRSEKTPSLNSVVDAQQVRSFRFLPEQVSIEAAVSEYLVSIVRASRDDPRVEVGVSPRGSLRLLEAARARAVIRGREYVTPDDIKAIAPAVMTHRLVLTSDAEIKDIEPAIVVDDVLDTVEVPATTAPGG